MQTVSIDDARASFNGGRDRFLVAFEAVPPDGVGFLKPGDDYSLGGLPVHVNFVLEHYANVLDTMVSAGFAVCRPEDPAGLEARAVERAKRSLSAAEVGQETATTRRLHQVILDKVGALGPDWNRKAPVFFGDAAEPLPTAATDILEWLTGHYDEHVPHITGLVQEWRSQSSPDSSGPLAVVAAFNSAFAKGDVDAVMALMTDDCVFDNTFPAPDGQLHQGQTDVRRFWADFFSTTDSPTFETEEIFASGDRVVARWRFSWGGQGGGHIRGADLFRIRDGKVAEKLSYVKG